MQRLFLLLLLVACFALGCVDQSTSTGIGNSTTTHENFAARLKIANAILANSERDATLAVIANDAAKAGISDVTIDAVTAIQSNNLRDKTCAEASVLLAKAGGVADASNVAKLIQLNSLRDQTLTRIARGD